ncbi:MAG TPA: FtsX-like permease family protein [Thermoanaerobaculia bacterium]|nr:FtsX-like permease family protein [Thermoanaerobaculia bacterium]
MIARALVLRPLLREKMRSALTILGIAVGVAVIVAIELSNQSALRAFRESVDAVAGRANYTIVSESGSIDEKTLLGLQPLWDKGTRFAPVIDVEGVIEPAQIPVRLLAVDLMSDLHFRDYRYAEISKEQAFDLFRSDSAVIPASFAREQHLKLHDPITLNFLGNRRTLTVRGILEPRGPATAFNGAIVVCDIAVAQESFGMRGRLTRIDLLLPEDVKVNLPPGLRMERPSRRNERVSKMLRAFRVNLFALAGVALLVGMFLVYNTVLISILRRRKDVGVLKTLGAAPRQIFFAFAGEGLLFGIAGALLGIAMGDGIAYGILKLIGRTINALYVTSRPEEIALTPSIIALGLAVGVALSFVSALQPSLEAAHVPPDAMIRPGLQQRISRARERTLALAAIACFIAGALVSQLPPWNGIAVAGYVAVLLVVGGFSLLAPSIVRLIAAAFAPLMRGLFGVVGQLAARSLPASLRRTAVASAALSLATGMMVAVALMVGSFRETVRIWVDQTISSDLWLRPTQGLTNADAALFPPEIADDLAKVPFIAAIDRVRGRGVLYGDSLISVGSGDFAKVANFGDLPMIKPRSSREALFEAERRNGVIVSESFSLKYEKDVGDVIRISGADFPIVGIYRDYSNDRGIVVMDRPLYIKTFHDDRINTVVIYLKKGISRDAARIALEKEFGPKYHAFAITNGSIRGEVMKIFDQTFLITYALLGVAIIVAVLGIVNTLAALILERTRELALLRVTGVTARELRTMLVLESTILGIVSTITGIVMGYVLSWILIYVINKQSFGWTIEFHTPAALIATSLAVTLAASALAGLVPARLANRIHIPTAIKSE